MRPLFYNPCPTGFHVLGNLAEYIELDALAVGLDLASEGDLEEWHSVLYNAIGLDYPQTPPQGADGLAEARYLIRQKSREALEGLASPVALRSAGGYAYAKGDSVPADAASFANLADGMAIAVRRSLPGGVIYRACPAADNFLDTLVDYIEGDRFAVALDYIPAAGINERRTHSRHTCARDLQTLRDRGQPFPGYAGGYPAEASDNDSRRVAERFDNKIEALRSAVLDQLPQSIPTEE